MLRFGYRLLAASCLLLAVLLPASVRATVATFLDEATLTRQAQSVVRGRVISQSVVLVGGRLWTDSTVLVSEVLKGSLRPGARMLVRQPGGESGGLGMRVAGAARFSVGEEVVLFARWTAGRHQPVGMAQGKYTLYHDGAGLLRARRDLSGIGFVRLDGQGRVIVQPASPSAAHVADRSLEELRGLVRGRGSVGGGR